MAARRAVTDEQRRAGLVARHHLGRTADDVVEMVRSVAALHSSDPLTPHLAAWARVPGFAIEDLGRALYDVRALWRLHAMRRTLFVVPADHGADFVAGAGAEVARRERRRVEGWLAPEVDGEVGPWLAGVEARTLETLAGGGEWTTREVTAVVPELATELTLGSGRWSTRSPLSSRLLFLLAMEGRAVRTRPSGSWRSSQYRWAATRAWFGAQVDLPDPTAARAAIVRRYLASHAPATRTDLRWWTGWTVAQVTAALDRVRAVAVDLDGGREGLVLPDDPVLDGSEPHHGSPAPAPRVALLPALDPTPMGWKERDWYLGHHGGELFDGSGNVGPTVWIDGRVVGGWGQRPDGEVVFRVLEDIGAEASRRIAEEAAALTAWLDGVVVTARFRTPLERELSR